MSTPTFLSPAQVAAALQVTSKAVLNAASAQRRKVGRGPLASIPWRRCGRRLLVSEIDFSRWCSQHVLPVDGGDGQVRELAAGDVAGAHLKGDHQAESPST
jgi:hypothetical protein